MKLNQAIEKLIENPTDVYEFSTELRRYELSTSEGFFEFKSYDGKGNEIPSSCAGGVISANIRLKSEWQLKRQATDFMAAINSSKKIRPIIKDVVSDFREADYWLSVTKISLDMVNGKWEVE